MMMMTRRRWRRRRRRKSLQIPDHCPSLLILLIYFS